MLTLRPPNRGKGGWQTPISGEVEAPPPVARYVIVRFGRDAERGDEE